MKAQATEPLPPFRIDPALLGGGALPPKPAVTVNPPDASASPASVPAPAPVTAVAKPMPLVTPEKKSPVPAPVATSVVALKPTKTPAPATVEPVDLGAKAARREESPPEVQERPPLPPLYSAHVEAGMLPNPQLLLADRVGGHAVRQGESLPSFIIADRIQGTTDIEMVAEGDVELRRRNSTLKADRLTQWDETDEVEAVGNVRMIRDSDRISGPRMRLRTTDNTGYFEQPEYSIRRSKVGAAPVLWTGEEPTATPGLTRGQGKASRMAFEGEGKYQLSDATYSTCTPDAGSDPDWFARTSDLRLDYEDQTGVAKGTTVVFKGMPIFYTPWMTFALNNQRKSGLLTPTLGSTTKGGQEISQPVYWNIASNFDATVTPRVMSKRGTLWNGEFRYLRPSFTGTFEKQYIGSDKLAGRSRSAYTFTHRHNLGAGFSGALDVQDVSDDTFYSDMSNSSTTVAQTNLLRQGSIGYAGDWWSANLLAQNYKTLQDPALPTVAAPYSRRPQLTLNARRGDLPLGLDFTFAGESVAFRHPTQVQATRVTTYPQLALPLQAQAVYVTPKIGVHSTRYALNRQATGIPDRLSRSVPIFSVDSGVTFERTTSLFDTTLTQTLEPRLFYVKIPAREQGQIPVFDAGIADFNFAQIFSENRYSGGDRIGDTDQLTGMVTSRLLDPRDGSEVMRGAVGQLVYFGGQNVTLPGEVARKNFQTDFLGAFTGRVMPKTYVDAGMQYSPRFSRTERLNLSTRYQPESGKVLNAGYRYTRDVLGQFDVSGQWPLSGGWHGVGRVNYSTKDRRMVESIAGLEYNGGCWATRVVLQRIATQAQQVNTAIFFQLELGDFASLGSSPIDLLKRNVPGYGIINQPEQQP
jgi:LPS-assembly protein